MLTPMTVLPHDQPGSAASSWPLRRELASGLPDGLATALPGFGPAPASRMALSA